MMSWMMNHLTTHVSASLCSSQVCRNFWGIYLSPFWLLDSFHVFVEVLPSKVLPFWRILLVYSTNLNRESVLGDLHTSFERAGNTRRQPDVVFSNFLQQESVNFLLLLRFAGYFALCCWRLKAPPRPPSNLLHRNVSRFFYSLNFFLPPAVFFFCHTFCHTRSCILPVNFLLLLLRSWGPVV